MTKCFFHGNLDAVAECHQCGKDLCDDCHTPLKGHHYCTPCLEDTVAPNNPYARIRNGFLVFLFSLMPGVGHLYLGYRAKGFDLLIAFLGSNTIIHFLFNGLSGLAPFIFPLLVIYSVFDAQHILSNLRNGIVKCDKSVFSSGRNLELIAILLITLGGIGILRHGLYEFVPRMHSAIRAIERTLPSFLLLGAGLFFLSKNQKDRRA